MAKLSLTELKSYFETGDRPNGANYVDLIDTLSESKGLGSDGNNESIITGIENTTVLETIPVADWRLVKYLVSISKVSDGDNKFYATEFTVLIDKDHLNISQYGIIDNDGDMGTVDVSRVGSNIVLSVIPNPTIRPVTVRYARMGLKA